MDPLIFKAHDNPDEYMDDDDNTFVVSDIFKGDIYAMGLTLYKIALGGSEIHQINSSAT